MSTYDVGIVGAGVHGLTAAYHLARRGVSTVVFERGRRAGGPTGQASGVVRAYYTNRFLAEVARDSVAALTGYVRTGGLYLHTAADSADAGLEHEVLTAAELADRFPELNLDGTAFGVWEERAGYADPHATALSYAARAVEQGATLLEHSGVCQIAEGPRSVKLLLDDGSGHEVDRLLVAAGPWTGPLLDQLGAAPPLSAERHVVAALRQRPADAGRAVPYVLIDIQHGYYSRPARPAAGSCSGPWPRPSPPTRTTSAPPSPPPSTTGSPPGPHGGHRCAGGPRRSAGGRRCTTSAPTGSR
ncbi:NAD(P)/FAD-dependent oxidoreductase [Dactylosporangium sp. NPDC051541]|uniref:NAD(P)/FAD-dependent oxidoreductase n=1 Tax=Dactylosporangium sp. NPDC051541 TaxID=3363977 RepID=UPI0037AC61A0